MYRSLWKRLSVTLVKQGEAPYFPNIRFLNTISTINSDSDSDDNHSCSESLIKSPALTDSILKPFEDFGFSRTQVENIISRNRRVLRYNDPEKTVSPKFDFLRSRGIPEADVIKLVTRDPRILNRSLHNHLMPSFDLLTSMSGSEQNAISIVKSYPSLLVREIPDTFEFNLCTLKNLGLPWSNILKLMNSHKCVTVIVTARPDWFSEVVESVLQMGFDASSSQFGYALTAMGLNYGSYWEGKLKCYQSLGFSEKEILHMFRKQPSSMVFSVGRIKRVVEFFSERFHWSPSKLAMNPHVMKYSLEKRVVPRCSVLQALWSRNKIGKSPLVLTLLTLTEKAFVETYVTKYEGEVPEVLEAYQGQLHFDEYNFDSARNDKDKAV